MNKIVNKTLGQKKAFTSKQIRLLKDILENKKEIRDLVILNLGIDTMLRASDLLKLKVIDLISSNGEIKNEIVLRQKKTKNIHQVAILEESKKQILILIKLQKLEEDDYIFLGKKLDTHLSVRQMGNLIKKWVTYLNLDPKAYGCHSLRRTKAAYIYQKTNNIEVVRLLLGQKSVTSTSSYLNINMTQALEIGREFLI